MISSRRSFLRASATAGASGALADLGFLLPISQAAAGDVTIDPARVRLGPDLSALLRLIRETPRDKCVPVFLRQFQAGLSYQEFLSGLFLLSLEDGDPHQVAQVYSAHRIGSEARTEERLLPLFWVLDRVKEGLERVGEGKSPRHIGGTLPTANTAADVLRGSIARSDPDQAERAIAAIARSRGPRQAMSQLWEHGARRAAGTLGHHPILIANSWRTLEAIGWDHAEPVLRFIARSLPNGPPDRTFAPNLARVERVLPGLPADWASDERDRGATIAIYRLLRQGETDGTSDLICAQLASGQVKAGAIWEAFHLVAADLIFRYKTGGTPIGGALIHAITSTNALHFGFDCCGEDRVRLLMLLQGAGVVGDTFVRPAEADGMLRAMDLLELKTDGGRAFGFTEIFSSLPYKAKEYVEKEPSERSASDEACRMSFTLLSDPSNIRAFQQAARTLLCVKASPDPHDIKYPAAAFEDASRMSPEWRPYALAASVHALHGSKSPDTPALVQVRAELS
ncbi:twin-arginine translocation signal domain-containing protein [Isosphaeraceae bacterium EP7]